MLEVYRSSSVEWKPSPVIALATSVDVSQVAATREDGSRGLACLSRRRWYHQLTIHGEPNSRVSTLVWCRSSATCGRLFSLSIDGSVSEWDLFHLKQKTMLDSIGSSIWQMAGSPFDNLQLDKTRQDSGFVENGNANGNFDNGDDETSDSEDDVGSVELRDEFVIENTRVVISCDDGCVRIYSMCDSDQLIYNKSLPRVSGWVLSVTWSPDANMIYSRSRDGFIRCRDAKLTRDIYRITVRLGGLGSGSEFCIWSLLALRFHKVV